MKKYNQYKNSGVEWLGEIPEHWEVKRFKHITNIQKGKLPKKIVSSNDDNLPPYMSMEYLRGGEENQWVFDKDAKVIDENKTLLLWDGSNAGEFLKSRKGVISSTVAEIEFKYIHDNFAWYYSKFLEIELRKKTIGMGIPHVNGTELKNFSVAIPPLQEQTAISNFLDDKTTKIDQAIAIKQKQIELLKERRQILIHKAVTRGLNDNVKFKDSGVEWIGEIPKHWEVKRLKYVANLVSDKMLSKGNPLNYIGMENIESWTGNYVATNSETEGLANYFKQGDILFGKLRPYLAKVYLAKDEGICTTEFLVYRNNNEIFNWYLHLLMLSFEFINLIDSSTYGSKMPRANSDFIGNQLIPIPPKEEQTQIAEFIEIATTKIATAISLKEQEIEKLKEYKMSLIDGVVTGKVKVC
jgi:restriction endonuclease S subunit